MWLKAFARAEIESHFIDMTDGKMRCRKFVFDTNYDEAHAAVTLSPEKQPRTRIILVSYLEPYRESSPGSIDLLAQRIVSHFLPVFLNPEAPTIKLVDGLEKRDLATYYKEHFLAGSTQRDFAVRDKAFKLRGYRLFSTDEQHHRLVYAADYREVQADQIARYIPTLKNKLQDDSKGLFVFVGFVEGEYLDKSVNNLRTAFSFPTEAELPEGTPREDTPELFADQIGLKEIRAEALLAVREDLKPFLDEMTLAKDKIVTHYVTEEAPQYRPLLKDKAEFYDHITPTATKTELDTVLHRYLFKKQERLRTESRDIVNAVESGQSYPLYREKFQTWMAQYNELGVSALAEHVIIAK
jgi:hypothetical protein